MLALVITAAGTCAASLGGGFWARARLARAPADGIAPTAIGVPHRWGSLSRALLRPHRWLVGLMAWLMILDTVLGLAAPWPLKIVVDNGLGHQRFPGWLAGLGGLSPVVLAVAAAASGLLLLGLSAVASYLVTFLAGAVGEAMTARLRVGLIDRLLRAAPPQAGQYPLGELASRLGSDTGQVSDTVAAAIETLIPDSALLAGMTVVTAMLDWRLTLIVLGVIPLYMLTARVRNHWLRGAQRRARLRSGELSALTADLLARLPAVHVFDQADRETRAYQQASVRAAGAAVAALDASARFTPVTDTLPGLGLAAALVAGTAEVSAGRLTIGGLLVFLAYLSSLTAPVRSLARLSTTVTRGAASLDRIVDLFRLPPLRPRPAAARPSGQVVPLAAAAPVAGRRWDGAGRAAAGRQRDGAAVALDRVSFSYRAGCPVLTSASLRVASGEFVCITGPSGAGKSTLLSLLMRLADPASGRITIDGHDITDLPLAGLRRLATLVPQDPWLHRGTIADNIGYGCPAASREQIQAAAERAGVSAFAHALPDGYDTAVGEHGRQLSGGQQRRIAVARALLRDTPVLLLDEPTAGLDPAAEQRLVTGLLAATRGRTLIMVTHQRRLARLADRVLRLDQGRIVAHGITSELPEPALLSR